MISFDSSAVNKDGAKFPGDKMGGAPSSFPTQPPQPRRGIQTAGDGRGQLRAFCLRMNKHIVKMVASAPGHRKIRAIVSKATRLGSKFSELRVCGEQSTNECRSERIIRQTIPCLLGRGIRGVGQDEAFLAPRAKTCRCQQGFSHRQGGI